MRAQTYDALNRVLSETSSGLTHAHTYDKANNRLTTTYDKSGRVLTRTYDAGNRLLTQEDVLSGEPTRLTSFAYDPQGNLLVKTLADSSTENRAFDVRNRVLELHVKEPDGTTTRLLQAYEYDLAGNLISLEESGAVGSLPTRVLTCAYDGVDRLIVEADQRGADPAIVTNYTYDKADNRTSREVFGGAEAGTTTYAIGNGDNGAGANQIASLTRPDTSVVDFTYDLNGSRTSRTDNTRTDTYSYDVWTRLLTLDLQTPANPGDRGLYEYSYDARTRRVSREEFSAPTVLSFQGGVSIQEYATSPGTGVGSLPSPTVEYVRGPDQGGGIGGILYSVRGGSASLAHSSARGDVVARVDATTSAMTWQAQYEAFGRRSEEAGTNEDRQRANSKDEDPTGLLNEGFRYRDLETGTFITRDPAGFVDGPNLYTYVSQNPWTAWDAEGLFETIGEYFSEVGEVWKGYGNAVVNTAKGLGQVVAHPIDTTVNVGKAVMSPVQTAKAIKNEVVEKWNSGNEGKGEIIGDVLIGIATGGAVKATAKTATVAKMVDKIAEVSDTAGKAANMTRKLIAGSDAPYNKVDTRGAIKRLDKQGLRASDAQGHIDPDNAIKLAEKMRATRKGQPDGFDNSKMDQSVIREGQVQVSGHHRTIAAEMSGHKLPVKTFPASPFNRGQRWSDVPLKPGRRKQ